MRRFLVFLTLCLSVLSFWSDGRLWASDLDGVVDLLELVLDSDPKTAQSCLAVIFQKLEIGELSQKDLESLRPRLQPKMQAVVSQGAAQSLYLDANILLGIWKDKRAIGVLEKMTLGGSSEPDRLRAFSALIMVADASVSQHIAPLLGDASLSTCAKGQMITALGNSTTEEVGPILLGVFGQLDHELQPRIVEVLTTRPVWSKQLLATIESKKIPVSVVNENQIRRMLSSRDQELVVLVGKTWGSIRLERSPDRERVIRNVKLELRAHLGDAQRGKGIFTRVCAQCHKIYGEGQEVGPDLTANGRSSFEQLLSNVFDPSLVIGASYQARVVVTEQGRLFTGLAIEDNDERVVLKVQGGKIESIPRRDIEEISISKLSMMPEGLEKQLSTQELVDLITFLCYDRPPADMNAQLIPGSAIRTE